ncbi:hypothetical protein RTM1035_05918 [Roseovarius sp. TM1035]|nr:hypothetical protein RTM1035_05918 [Roseovarius sp. TM1035]
MATFHRPRAFAAAQINTVGFPAPISQLLVNQGAGGLFIQVDYTSRFVGGCHEGHLGGRRLSLRLFDEIAQLTICILRKGFPSFPFFLLPLMPHLSGFRCQACFSMRLLCPLGCAQCLVALDTKAFEFLL